MGKAPRGESSTEECSALLTGLLDGDYCLATVLIYQIEHQECSFIIRVIFPGEINHAGVLE